AAEGQLRRAMLFDEQRGVPGRSVDDAIAIAVMDVHYRNSPDAARREVEEALRRHPLAAIPAEDRSYLGLAWLYADAGHPHRARLPARLRGRRHAGTDLSPPGRAVRRAGPARQGMRLLRTVPGPVEGRGPGTATARAGREAAPGEAQRRAAQLITSGRGSPR